MSAPRPVHRPKVPPPVLALACGGAMWAIATYSGLSPLDFPGRAMLAAALGGTGLAIDLVSIAAFVKARTTVNPLAPEAARRLVVSGLYRVSRNPMYLGLLLVLLGWAAWLGQPVALVAAAAFVILVERMQIIPEERALEEKFGDEYRAYKKRVRRWI